MLSVEEFVHCMDIDFYTGVPDSLLRPLEDYLMKRYGLDEKHHVIGTNEGNCTALAAGYYLATGKVAAVYLQNSGEGNIVNPVASLVSNKVYGIPVLFIIGWRGKPGRHDEPQHDFQGSITLELLRILDIDYFVISQNTSDDDIRHTMESFQRLFLEGKSAAFVICDGALEYSGRERYSNRYQMRREKAIRHILEASGDDIIICTTGKASRELFELRDSMGTERRHACDFLTIGSMGHNSSVALGIALQKPDKKVWCIDGDGAMLMHMGALALIGAIHPNNLVHIVFNNESHESVGGLPTAAKAISIAEIAKGCNYPYVDIVDNETELKTALQSIKTMHEGPVFLEIKCAIGSRPDLGRPSMSCNQRKSIFIERIRNS